MFRLVMACDQKDGETPCGETLSCGPFAWGRGLEPFEREIERHHWRVNRVGDLFCTKHRWAVEDLGPVSPELARLLRTFPVGSRVRAALHIIYGSGEEVNEGELGIVHPGSGITGLSHVQWDSQPVALQTSNDSLDPA